MNLLMQPERTHRTASAGHAMQLGHDENGALVPVEDFDYSKVEANVFQSAPALDLLEDLDPFELGVKLLVKVLSWVFQDGMKNPEGVKIRAIIVCWIFLKPLRPMTLTELSRGYGMKKQSLGRWVDQFKRDFPEIRTVHMRNLN